MAFKIKFLPVYNRNIAHTNYTSAIFATKGPQDFFCVWMVLCTGMNDTALAPTWFVHLVKKQKAT
jgi:hypothetical protein